jgi:hypothetical protein
MERELPEWYDPEAERARFNLCRDIAKAIAEKVDRDLIASQCPTTEDADRLWAKYTKESMADLTIRLEAR